MKNYSIGIADGARTEFHQTLGLTGAEVSFNSLPAGVSVPFVHSHKENDWINLKNSSIHKLYNILRHIKNGTKSFSVHKY